MYQSPVIYKVSFLFLFTYLVYFSVWVSKQTHLVSLGNFLYELIQTFVNNVLVLYVMEDRQKTLV